jgi:hypothetical protein
LLADLRAAPSRNRAGASAPLTLEHAFRIGLHRLRSYRSDVPDDKHRRRTTYPAGAFDLRYGYEQEEGAIEAEDFWRQAEEACAVDPIG